MVNGVIKGFPADDKGLHGFHIHALADISASCAGAGGHWNEDAKDHGAPGLTNSHSGDLGNIRAGDWGGYEAPPVANVRYDENVAVSEKLLSTAIGKAMVIHAGEDDLGLGGDAGSLTTGNAGGRLACCIITAVDNSALPANARCDSTTSNPGESRPKCAEGLCCASPTRE